MADHALLSASGSDRWMTCPASVRRTRDIPDQTSPFAEEGTIAHDIAESILLGKSSLDDHPEHHQLALYLDAVHELKDDDAILFVEERLSYTDWVPDGFGTSDATIIDPTNRTIHIVDLKWGKGVQVFAEGNSQMRLYALGALQRFMFDYDLDQVTMTIVQPRLDHISVEVMSVHDLLEWGEFVREAAELALQDDSPAVPSAKACRWCRVKNRCRERAVSVLSINADTNTDTDLMSFDEVAELLPLAADLEKWAKDIQTYALESALEGQTVKGYKLVEGRSMRRWTDNAAEVLASAVEDSDVLYEKKLLGIGAIEKIVGKSTVAECTVKPAGKPALVPSHDKRPEIVALNVEFPTGEKL